MKKCTNSRGFSFRKHYSPCFEQVHFQVYFQSPVYRRYISISFCSTDVHIFSGTFFLLYIKFNGFQAFYRKRWEKVLFIISQCYQIRKNLLIFCSGILGTYLLSYHTDQAFIKAHLKRRNIWGLFMSSLV
jgi:hypothetical protein